MRETTTVQPHHPGHPRRRAILTVFALAVIAAAVLAVVLAATDSAAHAGIRAVPGAECTSVPAGTEVKAGNGEMYVCVQKPGETCRHWHWVYNPAVPKSTRTAWVPGPCTTCHPSTPAPSSPPATTPPATTPPVTTAPPTLPPATAEAPVAAPPAALPVTGAPADQLTLAALFMVGGGGALRFLARRA